MKALFVLLALFALSVQADEYIYRQDITGAIRGGDGVVIRRDITGATHINVPHNYGYVPSYDPPISHVQITGHWVCPTKNNPKHWCKDQHP